MEPPHRISSSLVQRWDDLFIWQHYFSRGWSCPPCPHANLRILRSQCYWHNIGNPTETHIKSREISFAHSYSFSYPIMLKFCTEHGSITAVLCAKFQNDWTSYMGVMDERDFTRFELKCVWVDSIYCNDPWLVMGLIYEFLKAKLLSMNLISNRLSKRKHGSQYRDVTRATIRLLVRLDV